jgi:hypothetical protein
MRIRAISLIALVTLTALATTAFADDAKLKARMVEHFKRGERIFNTKDAKALEAVLAPDVVFVQKGKSIGRKEALVNMRQFFGMMKTLNAKFTVLKATQKGSDIVTTVNYTFSGLMTDPQAKKDHKMVNTGTARYTWAQTKKGLMMKRLENLSEKMTMDGKPMPSGG